MSLTARIASSLVLVLCVCIGNDVLTYNGVYGLNKDTTIRSVSQEGGGDGPDTLYKCTVQGDGIQCPVSSTGRLAVVIPYVDTQTGTLLANLFSWRHFTPCDPTHSPPHIDLVFYISRDKGTWHDTQRHIQEVLAASPTVTSCFRHVYHRTARLSPQVDTYFYGAPAQFHGIFDRERLELPGYQYILYMEPDARPIRNNWLSQFFLECILSPPFWSKGSVQKGNAPDWDAPAHINGNAIYRYDDILFHQFLCASTGSFAQYITYDTSLSVFLQQRRFYEYLHKFVYSEFIQNMGHTRPRDTAVFEQFLHQHPQTYIVHGKDFAAYLDEHLKSPYHNDTKSIEKPDHWNSDVRKQPVEKTGANICRFYRQSKGGESTHSFPGSRRKHANDGSSSSSSSTSRRAVSMAGDDALCNPFDPLTFIICNKTACPLGYWVSKETGVCTVCQPGQYGAHGQCHACPPGTYLAYYGARSIHECQPCAKGTHATDPGSTTCTDCPQGTYADTLASIHCNPCGRGHIGDQSRQIHACRRCPMPYSTTPDDKATHVDDCTCGLHSKAEDGECVCEPGYTLSVHHECVPCDKHSYKAQYGNQACSSCGKDRIVPRSQRPATRAEDCECSKDQQLLSDHSSCQCQEGFAWVYDWHSGQGMCIPECPAGWVRHDTHTHGQGSGDGLCYPCPTGASCGDGNIHSIRCPANSYLATDLLTCRCHVGWKWDDLARGCVDPATSPHPPSQLTSSSSSSSSSTTLDNGGMSQLSAGSHSSLQVCGGLQGRTPLGGCEACDSDGGPVIFAVYLVISGLGVILALYHMIPPTRDHYIMTVLCLRMIMIWGAGDIHTTVIPVRLLGPLLGCLALMLPTSCLYAGVTALAYWWITVLTPVLMTISVLLFYVLYVRQRTHSPHEFKARVMTSLVRIWGWSLFGVTYQATRLMQCTDDPHGASVLRLEPSIPCDQGLPAAVLVGIPTLHALALICSLSYITSRHWDQGTHTLSPAHDGLLPAAALAKVAEFFQSAFRTGPARYWAVLWYLRAFRDAIVIGLHSEAHWWHVVLNISWAVDAMMQLLIQPFKSERLNQIAMASLIINVIHTD